jgi:hypothetical protein
MIAVEIMDLQLRLNPEGKTFGSNAAAWWGYQARVPKADGSAFKAGSFTDTAGENDEIITIYEMINDVTDGMSYAVPLYQYQWPVLIALMTICVTISLTQGLAYRMTRMDTLGLSPLMCWIWVGPRKAISLTMMTYSVPRYQ